MTARILAMSVAFCLSLTQFSNAQIVYDFTGGPASPHFADLSGLASGTTTATDGVVSVNGTFAAFDALGVSGTLEFDNTDGLGVLDADEPDWLNADESIQASFLTFQSMTSFSMAWVGARRPITNSQMSS